MVAKAIPRNPGGSMWTWLEIPFKKGERLRFYTAIILAEITWTILVTTLLVHFGVSKESTLRTDGICDPWEWAAFLSLFVIAIPFMAFAEEVVRIGILVLIMECASCIRWKSELLFRAMVLVGAITSAAMFGLAHLTSGDSSEALYWVLAVQGVAGLIYNTVFLKESRLRTEFTNIAFGIICTTALHSLWNFMIAAVLSVGLAMTLLWAPETSLCTP